MPASSWLDQRAEKRTVHPWPGALPVPGDGVIVIGIATAGSTIRDLARQQIRLALQQLLGQLLGLPPDGIALKSDAGQAPRIARGANAAARNVGLSISHEAGLSLAAVNLHGAVGVDLMRVQEVADWEMVARDYLGAAVADALAGTSPERRSQAFVRAWTAREAGLKCQGLPLTEWTPPPPCQPEPCRNFELALPQGLIGTLAIPA
jgi:4'-phosphopantetheinyl transferase